MKFKFHLLLDLKLICFFFRRRESINTASTMRFSLSSPLHGDRGHPPSSPPQEYSEYWFTPTLVWQPNKRSRKTKKLEEKKRDRVLKTTNLTDVLPPVLSNHGHLLPKVRVSQIRCTCTCIP